MTSTHDLTLELLQAYLGSMGRQKRTIGTAISASAAIDACLLDHIKAGRLLVLPTSRTVAMESVIILDGVIERQANAASLAETGRADEIAIFLELRASLQQRADEGTLLFLEYLD